MMARHIIKKDWKLLWPLIVVLAAFQLLIGLARFSGGRFPGFPGVPASLLTMLAAAIVTSVIVLQDTIPGTRQDWLVRPIRRRDLFFAKLLFVMLAVQGPWLVMDIAQGVANGFPFSQAAGAAAACAAWTLLTMSVPVLAFAALTATMTETIIGGVAVFAILIAFLILAAVFRIETPSALTGFAWVPSLMREALLLVAAAGVLVLQYRSRRTWAARSLFAGALIVGQCMSFLPWKATFHVGQLLAAKSTNSAHGVAATFAPDAGRLQLAPGQSVDDVEEKPGFGAEDVAAENRRRRAEGARTVFLPLNMSGLTGESRLLADRSEVSVMDREGRILYRGTGNSLEVRSTDANSIVHQGIRIPGAVYNRINGEPLDIEVNYWFTLFEAGPASALPARDGDQRIPGIGWCGTKVDDSRTRILFQCLQPGERPPCLVLALEHQPTKQQNPEVSLCAPDYFPYPGHVMPDALSRFGGRLPFYDPSGFVHYAVGGPQLPEARVLVKSFRPVEHFVRRVVIRNVRLQQWEALPRSS
jgi:hypothetical protein